MNSSTQGAQSGPQVQQDDEDSINLLELLEVVIEQRWLIAAMTAVALLLGGTYAYMATPVFEANSLIQVEDSKAGGMNSMLGDMSNMFDIKSPATAEIEILRSRLVVGQAVANLQLDLTVIPKYVPLFGRWLARRAKEPSSPGLLGLSGYVSGTEALQVGNLQVDPALEGERFSVVLAGQGYELISPDGDSLGKGMLKKPLNFKFEGHSGSLLVASAVGLPGAEFYLTRSSRLRTTERLQKDMKIVEQGKQSGVISVSLEGRDPQLTASILNEVGSLYVRQNVERKAAEAEKTITFLNSQLPSLRQELESSEQKFNDFRNKNGFFDLDNEAKGMLEQGITLKLKMLELKQKRQELAARFTPQHPSVQVVDAQIKDLSGPIADMDNRVKKFPNLEQDLLRLTRDVKVNSELYSSLLNSFQQLRLVKEGKVGNVRIVDVAAVPERPTKPQRTLIVGVAMVLGLFAGIALAFTRNSLHPGIKNANDIEQQLGMGVFASVPHSREQTVLDGPQTTDASLRQLLATQHPNDPSIESLRSLRTALQFAMLDATNNMVLISGATPSLGKSFISANFAAVLAAGGKRVLLIDADMRRGHIHKSFHLERGHGLSELITGTKTPEQVIHKAVLPQLDMITTGTLPPNPAELLMSPATAKLLQTLAPLYDIVLIDTPPVLAVSDTQVIAPLAGTLFLVARAEVTTLGEMHETKKRINQSGVEVRGVIFNDLNIYKRGYGYGYGYGYKYSSYRQKNYMYGQAK